jgi:Reverse transcriptase (RNA-dependent DNA polymerase)
MWGRSERAALFLLQDVMSEVIIYFHYASSVWREQVPVKLGEPFGLEDKVTKNFDWRLSVARISNDTQSDFIFAPHLRAVYRHNAEGLIENLKDKLLSGKYNPGIPITIEVPKSSHIKIKSAPPRPGPHYSRPGSILMPLDRLFYQFLSDSCIEIVEATTNKNRSFSHRVDKKNLEKLFQPTRECWTQFQSAMQKNARAKTVNYVLKIDIANFFGSINQHTLVNSLMDRGLGRPIAERLEVVLTNFTTSRSSRGIIQGIFPSDLFGNFYLEPLDRFLADQAIDSARYVDDVYVFLESVSAADTLIKQLIPHLRGLDLTLNEAKSSLFPKSRLVTEEPDLEALFQDAIEEVRVQLDDSDFDVSYGFQSDWEEADESEATEEIDVEIEATKLLFDSISQFPGHEEEIERFCIPLFMRANSDHAVDHVINSFEVRPAMCQIYCSYLARFPTNKKVGKFLSSLLKNDSLYDWQLMWVLGALLQFKKHDDAIVSRVLKIFSDGKKHDAVRAVAAIFVGTHGDLVRRKSLSSACGTVTEYVQSAIFYVSRRWRDADGKNFHDQWKNRLELNSLIAAAWANAQKEKS